MGPDGDNERATPASAGEQPGRWALLLSGVVVNAFALWLVNDPRGGFGAAGTWTALDVWFVVGLGGAVLAGLLLARRGAAVGGAVLLAAFTAAAGVFLVVLPGNWNLALPVVLYDTWLAWSVVRRQTRRDDGGRSLAHAPIAAPDSRAAALRARFGPAARWLSAHAVVLVVLVAGYEVTHDVWAVILALVLAAPALVLSVAAEGPTRWRGGWRGPWLEWLLLLPLPWAVFDARHALVLLGLRQAVYLGRCGWASRESRAALRYLFARPARLFAVSFLVLILAGGLFLSLPVSAVGAPLDSIDALFLSVSAVCVTGLTTLDTSLRLSGFGQTVLLALLQVGGLGVMTLSSFAAILLGRRLGFVEETALGEMIDERRPGGVYRMVRFIVLATLATEALGAVVLFCWKAADGASFAGALAYGVFHAVSAFCNAGFSLQSDSLVGIQDAPVPLLTVSTLIIAGGLGFGVLRSTVRRLRRPREVRRLPLQARLALAGTAALLLAGALSFAVIEWNNTLAGMPVWERLLNASFLSVTSRTAGFNSVDTGSLAPATSALVGCLMFIGACAGSTAGGVKVTTAIVLALSVRAMLRGRAEAEVADRIIPQEVVFRATAITALALVTVVIATILLLATQRLPFEDVLFEALSAFGTVGLSRNATPLLDPVGKVIVMGLMFVGRVGPLTLALALRPRQAPRHRPPTEYVMVG